MVAMAAPKPANFGISKNDKISLAIAAISRSRQNKR